MFRITRQDNPNKYNLENIKQYTKNNKKYRGYYWTVDNKKDSIPPGFSGNLDDYEWLEHWKYPGKLYVCKEGYVRVDNNVSYGISTSGYITVRSTKYNIRSFAHRIIMEYLLGRDLEEGEIVDHINIIRTDNSFNNLRVTDVKGNMNNPLTIEKMSSKVVLTDLSGDFIMSGYPKDIYKFVYGKESTGYRDRGKISAMITVNILSKKYLCIKSGDIETLHKKMEKVTYVFNEDKTELLGSYNSIEESSNNSTIGSTTVLSYIRSGKLAPDGKYYMKGLEAVELVIKLGRGMAKEV